MKDQLSKEVMIDDLQNQIEHLAKQIKKLEGMNHFYAIKESCCNELFNNLEIGHMTLDTEKRIKKINAFLCMRIGYTESEIIGKSFDEILTDHSRYDFNEYFLSLKELLKLQPIELELFKTDKNLLLIRFVSHALIDENNNFVSAECVCFDLSEIIKSKEQLKAHELNLLLKDEMIVNKELELKKQNNELQRLNKKLKDQYKSIEILNNSIVENEYRLKLAFDSVNDGVWDWNIKTNVTYYSDRYYSMLGFEPFEFPHVFDSWKKFLHPDDLESTLNQINDHIFKEKTDYSVEYRMRTKSGNYKWILSRGKVVEYDSKGTPVRMIGTHVDITRQKEIELVLKSNEIELKKQNEEYLKINQKLIESNERINLINQQLRDKQAQLNSIMKTVPATIGLISGNTIVFINEYATKMTGYSQEDILGSDMKYFYTTDAEYERINNEFVSFTNSEEIKSIITTWKTKEGKIIDVQINATPIDSYDLQAGITFSAMNITEQMRREAELIKAKELAETADRLKTAFLTNMSHEIRTPMNGIVGFSELLKNKINKSKKEQYINIIVNSSKQLLKIITDIIDIAKIESGEIEMLKNSFSINKILQDEYNTSKILLENSGKTSINLTFQEGLSSPDDVIISDPMLLQKVIDNLLSNAIKFTEKGSIQFGYNHRGKDIEFYVLDTGIGIDENEQKVIFDRFRQADLGGTRRFGGNGLGLAISKSLINILNGNLWVESSKGEGSIFYFTIPYIHGSENEVYVNESKSEPAYNWIRHHILIVEDDMISFSLLSEMLEPTKVRITHAVTGLEAIRLCKKDETINLILMDMRLPELDGFQATKIIKENKKNIPIIAQTAHVLSEDREKCLQAGCDEYMSKPIKEAELLAILEKYFE
jgi:PAS domain S-box-containing protein